MKNHPLNATIRRKHFWNWIVIVGAIVLINSNCSVPDKISTEQKSQPSITFNLKGGSDIESLIFVKLGGFSDKDFRPFAENMEITMNEPINDLYQVSIKKGEGNKFISQYLWLNGDEIIVNGEITANKLTIDTVINSPLYYYTNEVITDYEQHKELEKGNDFLLGEITKTIKSPFSNQLASIFMQDNINNTGNLKKLQTLLDNQNSEIKNHIMSVHYNLAQMIDVVSIQTNDFKFNNENSLEVPLPLNSDSIYLIDFWFTQCLPCIADHQKIQSKIASFNEAGIKILGISTDYDELAWKTFLAKKNYSWSNFIEVQENEETLSEYLGISMAPTYLIVNGAGEILNRNNDLDKSITYLKESKLMKDDGSNN